MTNEEQKSAGQTNAEYIPGNPFVDPDWVDQPTRSALLAVAFELRTANLIAAYRTDADFPPRDWRQIKKRLGTE